MSLFTDSVAIGDEQDFNSANFNLVKVTKRICEDASTRKIASKVKDLSQIINQTNGRIIVMLEKDSSLFVNLAQCISLYEREFLEFPQKIEELKKLVKEAKNYPKPSFADVPPSPTSKQSEIINHPSYLVDAPVLYDCLVQQHKISESIDHVIKIRKAVSNIKKEGKFKIDEIDNWVQKVSQTIHKDTINRIKTAQFNSAEYQNEFRYLIKLGFPEDGVKLFEKYSTQQIEEQIGSVQNNGKLLQYIREYTDTLVNGITECVQVFMKIFKKRYVYSIVNWAIQMIQDSLPFENPEIFIGNYNVVKDSVIIMQHSLSNLEKLGISSLQIFDSLPDHLNVLLSCAAQHRIKEIADSIADDDWDVSVDGIRDMSPAEYPLSVSCLYFRSHVHQFLQEMKSLYLPPMFYNAADLMKNIVASYFKCCFIPINNDKPSVERFCVIITQFCAIQLLIFPEFSESFAAVTGFTFPNAENMVAFFSESIEKVEDMLVQTFIVMWDTVLPPDKIQWDSIDELEPNFQSAIDTMCQFLGMLNVPQCVFPQIIEKLVDMILSVVDKTAGFVEDAIAIDSFDFNWEYFVMSISSLLPKKDCDSLRLGIQDISSKVCIEKCIDDDDRQPPEVILSAVKKCLENNGLVY